MGRNLYQCLPAEMVRLPMTCATATLPPALGKLSSRLHVLTLTPFYPTRTDDAQGCFVAEPLAATADCGITNTVVAVRQWYRRSFARPGGAPDVHWKTFFSFPGNLGLPSSGSLFFSSVRSFIRELHRRNRIDIIHAHAALPCGHAVALLSRDLG